MGRNDHQRVYLLLAVLVALSAAVICAGLAIKKAMAHEGYPLDCCHDQHCHRVACGEVTMRNGNYVWHDMVFTPPMWRTSPDGGCHVCNTDKRPICIMPGGVS